MSRPALREALLLLQEDGLLSVRRGVGRTVNDRPPQRGFEQLQPLDGLLGPVRVRALLRSREEPTDFTTQHLLAPAGHELRFWESVLVGEALAVALSHEWARWRTSLSGCTRASARPCPPSPRPRCSPSSTEASRGVPLTAHSAISATLLGRRRGEQLDRPADTPAVLITQVVRIDGTPVMAAKHMLPTGAPALAVLQSC